MARVGFLKRICDLLAAANNCRETWQPGKRLEDACTRRIELPRIWRRHDRLEDETEWSLEVINSAATSIVWDEPFATDEDAYAEFERTVAEEGMRAFQAQLRSV